MLSDVFKNEVGLGPKARAFLQDLLSTNYLGFDELFVGEVGFFCQKKMYYIVYTMFENNQPYARIAGIEDPNTRWLIENNYIVVEGDCATITDEGFNKLSQWSNSRFFPHVPGGYKTDLRPSVELSADNFNNDAPFILR